MQVRSRPIAIWFSTLTTAAVCPNILLRRYIISLCYWSNLKHTESRLRSSNQSEVYFWSSTYLVSTASSRSLAFDSETDSLWMDWVKHTSETRNPAALKPDSVASRPLFVAALFDSLVDRQGVNTSVISSWRLPIILVMLILAAMRVVDIPW